MKRTQMTIYLTPEVADRLRLASEVASVPVGRHVGDMLESLIDSVEFVSAKMAEARREPAKALSRVRAIDSALGAQGVPGGDSGHVVAPAGARPQRRGRTSAGATTPLVIRG